MRKPKFNLLLDQERYDLIVVSLIEMKNILIQDGHFTDAVDDALMNVLNAKKRYTSIQEDLMKQYPSSNLKLLTVNNLVMAIKNYDYDLKDMDILYDSLREKEDVEEDLDDLIFISMKIAFLEGIRYQQKMEMFLNMNM